MRQKAPFADWGALLGGLEQTLAKMPIEGEVNRIRRDVSEACARAAMRSPGTYRLTVPTGGGKTLAALRFALRHAESRANGLAPVKHVLFVSPYISIVEQNAAVVRQILEPQGMSPGSVVLEHHSNLGVDETPGGRENWRRKVLTENWDAPVVFTTMAQLLESLFGGGTRAVRRLHAMARAVIVFDEAQTLPVKLLHLFNNAMNYLARECGTTVLLCTATQPRLHDVAAERGALRLAPDAEVIDNVAGLFRSLRRYTVVDDTERPGGWTQANVAEAACAMAQERGSCLVVLNTKKDVREVFQQCRERLPEALCVHLSTAMCPAHRARSLQGLKEHLVTQTAGKDTAPILCVSTNLIEAGVDIDFATVVRDLAGLDSLAQAAGRCNRHGRRPQGGRVLLVRLPDPPAQLEDVLRGRKISRRVLGEWRRSHPHDPFPLHSPEPMNRYFILANYERRHEMTDGPGVEYQVRAHFEWNSHQAALAGDRNDGKHFTIAQRSLERGGRQDVFLGTRECQGYVSPCAFGSGSSPYDHDGALDYPLMFHSFTYPDETGAGRLGTNFWRPQMVNGMLRFHRPDDSSGTILRKDIRAMRPKHFGLGGNLLSAETELAELEREGAKA